MKDKIQYLQDFCNKNHLVLNLESECGFGRECVGITHGNSYVEYNPSDLNTWASIPEFYSKKHYDIVPPNAYHKHTCFAVLGRGDEAVTQLYDWIKSIEEIGYSVETFLTGAIGTQAIISGFSGKCIKLDA